MTSQLPRQASKLEFSTYQVVAPLVQQVPLDAEAPLAQAPYCTDQASQSNGPDRLGCQCPQAVQPILDPFSQLVKVCTGYPHASFCQSLVPLIRARARGQYSSYGTDRAVRVKMQSESAEDEVDV